MIPGTDGQTIDQMSIGRIERIIETLRNESYKPNPAKGCIYQRRMARNALLVYHP